MKTQIQSWNPNGRNTYTLRVSSLGFEDLDVEVRADSRQLAIGTNNRLMAIIAWEKHNDIDESENLPSVKVI